MEKALTKVEIRTLTLNGSMLIDSSMNVKVALEDMVMNDERAQAEKTALSK